MTKELMVVAACTKRAGLLDVLEEQLAQAGIPFHLDMLPSLDYGLGSMRQMIATRKERFQRFSEYDKVVQIDAWDYLFWGTKDDVFKAIPDSGVLLPAERNCWPDSYLADSFPETRTPWKYVNGGGLAGKPAEVLRWLDYLEHHPFYAPQMVDQQWLNWMRVREPRTIPIDYDSRLFYCAILDEGELIYDGQRLVNTLCGTNPLFLHFNGKTPSEPFLRAMMERSKCA